MHLVRVWCDVTCILLARVPDAGWVTCSFLFPYSSLGRAQHRQFTRVWDTTCVALSISDSALVHLDAVTFVSLHSILTKETLWNGWSNYWEYEHQKVGDCGSNSPFIPSVLFYGRRTDWWVATFTNPPRFDSLGFVSFYYTVCCHSFWCATLDGFRGEKESLCVLGRSEKLRNGFVTVVSKMGAYFTPSTGAVFVLLLSAFRL